MRNAFANQRAAFASPRCPVATATARRTPLRPPPWRRACRGWRLGSIRGHAPGQLAGTAWYQQRTRGPWVVGGPGYRRDSIRGRYQAPRRRHDGSHDRVRSGSDPAGWSGPVRSDGCWRRPGRSMALGCAGDCATSLSFRGGSGRPCVHADCEPSHCGRGSATRGMGDDHGGARYDTFDRLSPSFRLLHAFRTLGSAESSDVTRRRNVGRRRPTTIDSSVGWPRRTLSGRRRPRSGIEGARTRELAPRCTQTRSRRPVFTSCRAFDGTLCDGNQLQGRDCGMDCRAMAVGSSG